MVEDSKVHRHPISHLQWDAAGACLLTADTEGKVRGAQAYAALRLTSMTPGSVAVER
jgi:hypothetical protein